MRRGIRWAVMLLWLGAGAADLANAQTAKPAAPGGAPSATEAPAVKSERAATKGGAGSEYAYALEPEPKWVTTAPAEADGAPGHAPMHYALIDYQTRVDAKTEVRYERLVRVVDDAAGLQQAAQLEIVFDPSFQKLALHKLTVVRGGKKVDRIDRKLVKLLQRETQLERQIYDGRVTASIVLDDIRVGDRVEFSYSVKGRNPVFGGRFVDRRFMTAQRGPTSLFRIRLLAPQARDIRYLAPKDAEVVQRVEGDQRETIFLRKSLPQFAPDVNAPDSAYLGDEVQFSEFADWAAVASWSQQVFSVSADASGDVVRKADEIQGTYEKPIERLAHALDFVQTEIRYFGTEIGPNSHQPAPPDTVLRQRFGDCKDKASLLVALLRRMQIDADPVLVSVHYREHVDRLLPSALAFDHVIVRAGIGEQVFWLDATRAHQTGPLAQRQPVGLGKGLLAQSGAGQLVDLPSPINEQRMLVTDTFRFESIAKDPILEARLRYRGDYAELIRELQGTHSIDEIQAQLFGQYVRLYPQIRPNGSMRIEEIADDDALDLVMLYSVPRFWRFPDQTFLVGDYAFWSIIQALAHPNETSRTREVRINFPGVYRHVVRIEYPEDIAKDVHPSNFDESNADFVYHLVADGSARLQQASAELRLLQSEIAPADWSTFSEKVEKLRPRLGGVVRIGAVRLDQTDKLKSDVNDLKESIRKGQTKAATLAQITAQVKLRLLTAQLESGRLAPYLRVDALVARGTQLDLLGRSAEAQADFDEALRLDPERPETYADAAVNALERRQDARAVDLADQALKLAGSSPTLGPRYTKVYANYFQGKYQAARDDLVEILKTHRVDVPRSYGAIWLYLSARRLGQDGSAAIKEFDPEEAAPKWPYPIVEMFNGKRSLDEAIEAAKDGGHADPGKLCELYFYAAEKSVLDGDPRKARANLRKSIDTGVVEFNEYGFAQRELDAVGP